LRLKKKKSSLRWILFDNMVTLDSSPNVTLQPLLQEVMSLLHHSRCIAYSYFSYAYFTIVLEEIDLFLQNCNFTVVF